MGSNLRLRSPTVLAVLGVSATVIVTLLMVVITLLLTGGAKAVSDNAALIGALVGLGGVFTTQMVNSALEDRRAQQARLSEEAQRERELEIENQRAQDAALQAYIGSMERLLIEENLPATPEDSKIRVVARSRTLTVLPRLDGSRKASVLQFLYEAGLISGETTVVKLANANLSEAYLSGAYLIGAYLSGPKGLTNEELEQQANSLKGAIMPDGSQHP